MAEGFEPYHVPQQSRRDKLRVIAQNHHPGVVEPSTANLQGCTGFPLYDPSLLSSDLLTCATTTTTTTNNHNEYHHHHHHQNPQLEAGGCKGAVKEDPGPEILTICSLVCACAEDPMASRPPTLATGG